MKIPNGKRSHYHFLQIICYGGKFYCSYPEIGHSDYPLKKKKIGEYLHPVTSIRRAVRHPRKNCHGIKMIVSFQQRDPRISKCLNQKDLHDSRC